MKMHLLSGDERGAHLVCEGKIAQLELLSSSDLLTRTLGGDVYQKRVLLSLERITFLDTAGISWMLTQHKGFTQGGGLLVFCSIPPQFRSMLSLLQVDQVLRIADDEQAGRLLIQGGE